MRGGRTRFMQGSSPSSTVGGPSLHELVSSGIKVDTLKQLMAKDREDGAEGIEGAPIKLIALEQVTLRGEDLTSEFTNKTQLPHAPAWPMLYITVKIQKYYCILVIIPDYGIT